MTLKERWSAVSQREQRLLIAAAIVVVLAVFYLAFWQPLQTSTHLLSGEVAQTHSLVAWLRSIEPEVSSLQGTQRRPDSGSLLSLVNQSTKASGLAAYITRLQPKGDDEVRLWFEKVPYQQLIRWLLSMEVKHGASVAQMTISRSDAGPGLVSARAMIHRAP